MSLHNLPTDPADPAAFGALVRQLRDARGLTQKALAELAETSQASLSAWESGASLPRRDKLDDLAAALDAPLAQLIAAYRRAGPLARPSPEEPEAARPLSVERLHAQARDHVRAYGADALSVWVLGASNLSVMRRPELLARRWRENLLWGVDYTIVWVLDLIEDAADFATAFTTLAALEARVAGEWPAFVAGIGQLAPADRLAPAPPARPGMVNHIAVTAYGPPARALAARYEAAAEGARRRTEPAGRVHPLRRADAPANTPAQEALVEAVRMVLRQWQPETGVVIYRPHPDRLEVPAAANIRLMPVSEAIVTHTPGAGAEANFWFWLAPTGAARLVDATMALEAALGQLAGEG